VTTATFSERIGELRRMTGAPEKLHGQVEVNQVYAHYQHEHLEFHHPRGGQARFLQAPLLEHFSRYLGDYARTVLSDGGQDAMRRSVEHLSDQVETQAPREWGDLRKSGHPEVHQAGRVVYDRPPKVHRLTAEELRVKSRAILRARLAAGLTVYFMRNGKIMVIPGANEPHGLRGRL
jgi:hypothetical protein